MTTKIIRILLAAVVMVAAGIGGYYFYLHKTPVLKVENAVLAPVSEYVYGSGTIEPVQWAKVVPRQVRRLIQVCHCEGSMVKEGQSLGRQDDSEETGQLKELEVRHAQLLRDLDRADTARKSDKITKAEFEQRETAVKESNERITAQKNRIENLVLRSPMDGMVLRRDGEVGEIVGPTDVLFWVGIVSPKQVVAEINEEDIMHVALGQTALLTNEAFANRPMRATVSQITPKGDPTKKTFRVYLRLPGDTPLRIGMTVEVNIIFRETPSAIIVPNEALLSGAVQVVQGDQIRRVTVSTGVHGSKTTEIVSGIAAGTTIAVPARKDLADGARVRIERASTQTSLIPEDASTKRPTEISVNQPDAVDQAISSALAGHIDGVVNAARRESLQRP
jgi:RND family efflux transporter MFP subunit